MHGFDFRSRQAEGANFPSSSESTLMQSRVRLSLAFVWTIGIMIVADNYPVITFGYQMAITTANGTDHTDSAY